MKTVRIALNIGTQDQKRLELERLYREREIVDFDDDKANILISEGKAWELGAQKEKDTEALRQADIRAVAFAAAEREAGLKAAKEEADAAIAKAKAAAESAPKPTDENNPTPKPVSSRELGTEPHERPLAAGGKKDKI